MTYEKEIFELTKNVVLKIAPLESNILGEIKQILEKDPDYFEVNTDDVKKGDLGFGDGSNITFLAPWIIYVIKELIALIREVSAGVIIDSVTNEKSKSLAQKMTPELVKELKTSIYERLHKKGIKGREARKIADEVIDVILSDPKNASILFNLIIEKNK